ncbi:MAG: serine/threonine-protein phosphatase [Ktedonobacterales bacterium]|nr:serine/threonine-protein phosphatase [Ktedonobacterales bacterium]
MTPPPSRATGAWATRLYRLVLRAYPRAFREEYADEMALLFHDTYRAATQHADPFSTLQFWVRLVGDVGTSVCREHITHLMHQGWLARALAGREPLTMALQFTLDVAQHTDIGRARPSNEDNLITVVPTDPQQLQTKGALFVVSDGLGGHSRGEVASEMAVQGVRDAYYQNSHDDIPTALQASLTAANSAIFQANERLRAQPGNAGEMGATCVAAVLHAHMLYVANVGDSRVYVLHQGQLRQITRDHSIVAQMVERGELTPAAARTHEQRNIIYRSLGRATVEVDSFALEVAEDDAVIHCTDGLSGVLGDEEVRAIVAQYPPAESVQRLIASANAAGGPDNVTAIVVRVTGA